MGRIAGCCLMFYAKDRDAGVSNQLQAVVPLSAPLRPSLHVQVSLSLLLQTYSADPQNVAMAGGALNLVAQKGAAGFTSGRIRSKGSWYPGMPVGAALRLCMLCDGLATWR